MSLYGCIYSCGTDAYTSADRNEVYNLTSLATHFGFCFFLNFHITFSWVKVNLANARMIKKHAS